MDPVSCLSLAAAILQFVDFSSKLVVKGYGAYKSREGISESNRTAGNLAQDIEGICTRLASTSVSGESLSPEERKLSELATRCHDVADQLSLAIDKLKVQGRSAARSWSAARAAVREVVSASKIKDMCREVNMIRDAMAIQMLCLLRNEQSGLNVKLVKVEEDLTAHAAGLAAMKTELIDHIKQLRQQAAHDTTGLQLALSKVTSDLQVLKTRIHEVDKEEAILKYLYHEDMHRRLAQVHDAWRNTYQWIFDEEEAGFSEWLTRSEGQQCSANCPEGNIFWITGKPASGKTTLMKLILNSSKTRSLLDQWAGDRQGKLISHFFWNAGTSMQKTLLGMLRSLVFQILRDWPHLISESLPGRWTAKRPAEIPWTVPELMTSLRFLLAQPLDEKLLIMIDGLDEYEDPEYADAYEITKIIMEFSLSPAIKLVVASRPLTTLMNAYDGQRLVQESWTRDDLNRYIVERLGNDERFLQMKSRELYQRPDVEAQATWQNSAEQLIQSIIQRAKGVFLWVKFVITSLLEGLSMNDDLTTLHRRIDLLPDGLMEMYEVIAARIQPVYSKEAFYLAELMLAGHIFVTPLSVAYIALEGETSDAVIGLQGDRSYALYLAREHYKLTRSRLINWSGGLFECYTDWLENHFCPRPGEVYAEEKLCAELSLVDGNSRIEFAHRTVFDFLKVRHSKADTRPATIEPQFHRHRLSLSCSLFSTKLTQWLGSEDTEGQFHYIIESLRTCDNAGFSVPPTFLEEIGSLWNSRREHDGQDIMDVACYSGLVDWVDLLCETAQESLENSTRMLYYATQLWVPKFCTDICSIWQAPGHHCLVRYLLNRGSDPNARNATSIGHNNTAWLGVVMGSLQYFGGQLGTRRSYWDLAHCDLIVLMLGAGADINAQLCIHEVDQALSDENIPRWPLRKDELKSLNLPDCLRLEPEQGVVLFENVTNRRCLGAIEALKRHLQADILAILLSLLRSSSHDLSTVIAMLE